MKPPICAFCGLDFRDDMKGGDMVSFRLTSEDKEFNKRFDQEGITGHPAGQDWFCSRHIKAARRYSHLSMGEAMTKMTIKSPWARLKSIFKR